MAVVAVALLFDLFGWGGAGEGGWHLWPSWIYGFSSHYLWNIFSHYLLNISSAPSLLLLEFQLQVEDDINDSAPNLSQLLDALFFFLFQLG